MRVMSVLSVVIMTAMVSVLAGADEKKAATQPLTWSTTMPAIELSNRPLEKVLNELKQKLPGFDFKISRINVPHDFPVLPTMTVENISVGDFFNLLPSQIPGLQVSLSETHNQYIDPSPSPPPFATIDVTRATEPTPPPEPVVRLFGLSDAIPGPAILKGNADVDKQGVDDALSLIQAALDVHGETPPAILKVHAPTQTLIFKGTPAQADIVANAIAVLQASAKSRSFAVDLKPSAEFAKLKPATTQSTK